MKRLPAVLSLLLLLAQTPVLADSVFGNRPNLKGVIRMSELLEHPDRYLNKDIRVEGIATDVCPKRGCWMKVSGLDKKGSLMVKVQDGEMVFPLSARGKSLVLQGRLVKSVMPRHDVLELEQARAEKAGQKFDPASVKGDRVMYMFKPTGVLIHDGK
ncbi:MAG: DUF4920 domain-containing protein [Candidatus Sericytochromatia bacterium]